MIQRPFVHYRLFNNFELYRVAFVPEKCVATSSSPTSARDDAPTPRSRNGGEEHVGGHGAAGEEVRHVGGTAGEEVRRRPYIIPHGILPRPLPFNQNVTYFYTDALGEMICRGLTPPSPFQKCLA